MSNKFGNKFVQHSVENEAETLEQRAKELEGGEKAARIRIKDGVNVLWVLPRVGNMEHPMSYKMVHYNPFHLCNRKDPSPDPRDPAKLLEDKNFKNCPRDIQAWEAWEAAGKPKTGDAWDAFRRDMPSVQVLVQAVNLTPFFGTDSTKKYAVPNVDLVKKWGAAFVEAINTGEIPEGMPEDIEEAARAGVNALFVSKTVGELIRSAYSTELIEDEEGNDPLFSPDKKLLQIVRRDGAGTYQAGGHERKTKDYEVRFTLDKFMKTWELPEGLIDVCVDKAVDLTNIALTDGTVEDKARSLHRLTEDEMAELLTNAGHSFTPKMDASDVDEATQGFTDVSDPNSFGASALAAASKRELNELRRSSAE